MVQRIFFSSLPSVVAFLLIDRDSQLIGTVMIHAYSSMFLPADSIMGKKVFIEMGSMKGSGNTRAQLDTNGPLYSSNPGYVSLIAALLRAPFAVLVLSTCSRSPFPGFNSRK